MQAGALYVAAPVSCARNRQGKLMQKHLKRLLLAGAILFLAAAAVQLYLYSVLRQYKEAQYIVHLRSSYLPLRFEKDKRWPTSLDSFEQDLIEGAGKRYLGRSAEYLLSIHRQGKPRLVVLSADSTTFRGEVKFTWLFGRSYQIEARK
jgi:hypothetical protein